MAVLLAVALLGRLLPLQWMRRRSIGRFLLCSAAVAGLAWLLSMGLWQNVDRAADDSLGVLAPTLFIYALFLLPGEVLMAILSAILNSRGGGGEAAAAVAASSAVAAAPAAAAAPPDAGDEKPEACASGRFSPMPEVFAQRATPAFPRRYPANDRVTRLVRRIPRAP